MQGVADFFFAQSLRARGYNNCCDIKKTGEENFLQLVKNMQPKYCIDIGANVGNYSKRILETTQATVLAFEPQPAVFEKLSQLETKFPGRIIPVKKGVGRSQGAFELYYGDENSEVASFSEASKNIFYVEYYNKNSIKAEMTTLDHEFVVGRSGFDFYNVDLVKLDTEGLEYDVLLGAEAFIRNARPKIIQIEHNWHQLFECHTLFSFHKLLEDYRVFRILPFGLKLHAVNAKEPESNYFSFSNFVFVRSDLASMFL